MGVILAPYLFKVSAGPDLWWHIKTGVDILQKMRLEMTDSYSYTAFGFPWINHEWLSEVFFSVAFLFMGDRGLLLLRALIVILFTAGLARLCWLRIREPFLILVAFLFSMPYFSLFLNMRPHSFTYLFVIITLLLLEKIRQGKTRWAWAFIPLMLFWANMHGGFVFGLALITFGLPLREKKELFPIFFLCLLVTLVNPYGLKLYVYLVKELTASHGEIAEWEKLHPQQFFLFASYLLIPLVSTFFAKKIQRKTELFFLFIAAAGTYLHRRFLILLIVFSVLIFFEAMAILWKRRMEKPIALAFLIAAILPFSVTEVSKYHSRVGFHLPLYPLNYPSAAIDYLKKNDFGPNLAVTFQWGGYVIWNLSPKYKVSVDGRALTVYPKNYVADYLKAYKEGNLEAFTNNPRPNALLIENAGLLYQAAKRNIGWHEIYRDKTASVFVPVSKI